MKPFAVLGVGPAGLAAVHACRIAGVPVALFSKDLRQSKLGGAQFLHVPLPEINTRDDGFTVQYVAAGDPFTYKRKVYGDEDVPFVSMENVTTQRRVPAWSLIDTYDRLWAELVEGVQVNEALVGPNELEELTKDFEVVISSVPKTAVCRSYNGIGNQAAHAFFHQEVRIMNRSVMGEATDFDNTIIYDGTPNVSWYRTAIINGIGSTEWGAGAPDRLPYEEDLVRVRKPIRSTCNCWDGRNVLFVGRYGTWEKGQLVHHAFERTMKEIARLTMDNLGEGVASEV